MKTLVVNLTYFDCADTITGVRYGWYLSFADKLMWHGPYTKQDVKILQSEKGVECQFVSEVCFLEEVIANANALCA